MKMINLLTKVSCLFLMVLAPYSFAASVTLNSADGVSLSTIMSKITHYKSCMDEAQMMADSGRAAYRHAQSKTCRKAFIGLSKLMDNPSLKSVEHISWQRWREREVKAGFSVQQRLQTPKSINAYGISTIKQAVASGVSHGQ